MGVFGGVCGFCLRRSLGPGGGFWRRAGGGEQAASKTVGARGAAGYARAWVEVPTSSKANAKSGKIYGSLHLGTGGGYRVWAVVR